jgi:uncharacterized protein (DUF2235 family)
MTKNIVICMDGTWNDPADKTNVFKLFQSLKAEQSIYDRPTAATCGDGCKTSAGLAAYYLAGVGTAGLADVAAGGVLGVGVHTRVLHAFILASSVYEPGDKLWIFGFSRGAWSARSLAGMITKVGLMSAAEATGEQAGAIAQDMWSLHKKPGGGERGDTYWSQHDDKPIKLVGVWDTVGAMGVPLFNGVSWIDGIEKKSLDFADLDLSPRVEHGRHALAINEHRFDFEPTLWNDRDNVKQIWFTGGHSDVGGGYPEAGLSDITLKWMAQEIQEIDAAFPFDLSTLDPHLAPDFGQNRHDEAQNPVWRTKPRTVPANAQLHWSVEERMGKVACYRPAVLKQVQKLAYVKDWNGSDADVYPLHAPAPCDELAVGQSKQVAVHAERYWNAVQLKARAGERYRIVAAGEWWDASNLASANGYKSPNKLLSKSEHARRVKDADWFRLVAAVHPSAGLEAKNSAVHNPFGAAVSAVDDASELLAVGADGEIAVKKDGFLYLFANDLAITYGNNSGELKVTVTRTQ